MAAYLAAGILFFSVLASSASVEETLASPLDRDPPIFPQACVPADGQAMASQTVTVAFDLTDDGMPENVRAMESTDACFEDAAVAAVRRWQYEPRRVNGIRKPQTELETTFTFNLSEETQAEDFDARPFKRVPPKYPDNCVKDSRLRSAKKEEYVVIVYDVTEEGRPENLKVTESSNGCFDASAKAAVRKWRYRPKTVSGKPVKRTGVETKIIYQLIYSGDDIPAEKVIRRVVEKRLNDVGRMLSDGKDPKLALAELEKVEAKYGDSFSKAESGAFHQIRGFARIADGDYEGALDDLRIAQQSGVTGEALSAIEEAIVLLEDALAE